MTLTLPTPDAGDTARQRFALELLLQQPVPGPEQLLASRNLLSDALPDVSPDQWRALQAMPIAIGADHLDIAIPSQWRDQESDRSAAGPTPHDPPAPRHRSGSAAGLGHRNRPANDGPAAEQSSNPAWLQSFLPDDVQPQVTDAHLARTCH